MGNTTEEETETLKFLKYFNKSSFHKNFNAFVVGGMQIKPVFSTLPCCQPVCHKFILGCQEEFEIGYSELFGGD